SVGTELPEHLLHLVDARERLHEHDRADRRVLEGGQAPAREVEEVAVPARLGRELELREVEVDAVTAVGLRASRVEERERGPEDRGVDGRAVDRDVGLVEVEPALAVHEERELSRRDPVALAALAILERELAVDRGETVVRGADRVDEPVAARILVVVQVALGALALGPGIERVDEHGRDRARARDLAPVPKRLLFAWRPKGCQWQNGPRSIRPCEEARWPRCCSS